MTTPGARGGGVVCGEVPRAGSGFLPEVEGEVCPLVASWEQLVKVSSQEAPLGLLAGRSTWAGNSSPQDRI